MSIKVIQSLDFTAFSVNFRKDKKTCFHLRNYSLGGKMVGFLIRSTSIIPCLRSTIDNKLTANAVFFLTFTVPSLFLIQF